MGMRNGKKTYNVKGMDLNDFILGCVIPFILFWGGILTPVVTDSLLVWIFCLVPFYGFVIVSDNVLRGRVSESTFVASIILGIFSSILLSVALFAIPCEGEIRNVCRIGFFNIIPGLLILLFGLIDHLKFFCFFPFVVSNGDS